MKRFFTFLFTAWIGALASAGQAGDGVMKVPPPRAYAVEVHGRVAGYCVEQCSAPEVEGGRMLIYSSRTVLRTGPAGPGDTGRSIRNAAYWVDAKAGRVARARLELRQSGKRVIREADFEEGEARYRVKSGTEQSRTVPLPDDARVSYRYAYPAVEALRSGRDVLTLSLFRMSDGTLHRVTVRGRGEADLAFHDTRYPCRRFTVEEPDAGRSTEIWVTPEGELVKLERAAEGLTLRPAEPEVSEKLLPAAQRRLSFLPVNEAIDNRSALTYLWLEAVIECPEVATRRQLEGPGQTFEGTVKEGMIEGRFRIRSFHYDGRLDAGFPAGPEEIALVGDCMMPEPLVESDAAPVLETAHEETEDLANRWHAAHALGLWVRNNIVYDASAAEGARAALERYRAGSAGMARLHAALCRSIGIPARVVMGAFYINGAGGGGFIEHYWIEIFNGSGGWIPLDAAAGQLGFLDAGHLRLAAPGPHRLLEIRILDYIPKSGNLRTPVERIPSGFPLPPGGTCRYVYYLDDQPIGTEEVHFGGAEQADREGGAADSGAGRATDLGEGGGAAGDKGDAATGEEVFRFTTRLAFPGMKGASTIVAGRDGRTHRFEADFDELKQRVEVKGSEAFCTEEKKGEGKTKRVPLPPEGFFYENRHVFLLGFTLSRVKMEPGEIVQLEAFQPSSLRVLTLQVEYLGRRELDLRNGPRSLHLYDLVSGGHRVEVGLDDEGKAVLELEQGGRVRVELDGGETGEKEGEREGGMEEGDSGGKGNDRDKGGNGKNGDGKDMKGS